MSRAACVVALLVSLLDTSCVQDDTGPSLVDRLRVLAVRAEPPEIAPGQATTLDLLIADPRAPAGGRAPSFLWLACTTTPGASVTPCSSTEAAGGPEGMSLTPCESAAPGALAQGGLCLIGDQAQVTFRAPEDLLPPTLASRQVVVISVAAAGASGAASCALALADTGLLASDCEVSLKRITVSRGPDPNRNPTLVGLSLDGVELGEGEPAEVPPGVHLLRASAPADAAQSYTDRNGAPRTEELLLSWYFAAPGECGGAECRAAGDFKYYRTELPGEDESWTTPDIPGTVQLWVVVRDPRGGVGWLARSVTVR